MWPLVFHSLQAVAQAWQPTQISRSMTSPSFFWPGRGSGSEVIVILSYCANGPAKFPDPWENSREKSNSSAIIADKIFHINGLGDSSGTANREFSRPKSGKLRPNREISGNFEIPHSWVPRWSWGRRAAAMPRCFQAVPRQNIIRLDIGRKMAMKPTGSGSAAGRLGGREDRESRDAFEVAADAMVERILRRPPQRQCRLVDLGVGRP